VGFITCPRSDSGRWSYSRNELERAEREEKWFIEKTSLISRKKSGWPREFEGRRGQVQTFAKSGGLLSLCKIWLEKEWKGRDITQWQSSGLGKGGTFSHLDRKKGTENQATQVGVSVNLKCRSVRTNGDSVKAARCAAKRWNQRWVGPFVPIPGRGADQLGKVRT